MSSCGWAVASPPWRRGRHRQDGVGLTARVTTQSVHRSVEMAPSAPFCGICVHCCAVGLGCGWPWDRNSVHRSTKMAPRCRFGAFVYTVGPWAWVVGGLGIAIVYTNGRIGPLRTGLGRLCTLLRCCGQARGRNSVHRSAKMAPRGRFGAFVYTVATRVAIRIATRATSGGTSASTATACRRRPLAGPSRLVGKTGPERVAPLLGWHLRRGVNPHEPPKSPISCSVLDGKMLLIGSPA